jgi:ferritin-like metal-binding protein YciE
MGLFSGLTLNTLDDLFIAQIEDLYDAETRLTEALPKMVAGASNPQLKSAIQSHLRETEGHVTRLESIFRSIGVESKRHTCQAMKGLIAEGSEVLESSGDPDVIDAAIIAAAQRVEHYEIAGYGTARTLATRLGRDDLANLLDATLQEEGAADKKLTQIAESSVNAEAAAAR